jgi:signal peptidase I
VNLNADRTTRLRVNRTRFFRNLRLTLAVLPLVGWALWLRPEFLGGRADYIIVGGRSMLPTLRGGDLVIVQRKGVYRVDDVVAYHIPDGVFQGRRIIHRIVGGDPVNGFVLRGDNNAEDDLWYPGQANIEGRLWLRVPSAGLLVAFARSPAVLAAVAGGFVFGFMMTSPTFQRPRLARPATWRGDTPSAREP